MLIPFIQLPSVIKYSEDDSQLRNFFNFIDRIQIFGFVLLNVSDRWERSVGTSELLKIVQKSAIFMSGFRNDDVEIAGLLLDKGLRVAFFKQQTISVTMEAVSRLPRQRVGITIWDNVATADSIAHIIDLYSKYAAHFIFKYAVCFHCGYVNMLIGVCRIAQDVTTEDSLAALEEAKAQAAKQQVQIYFICHYSTPSDAGSIASTHESIHAVIYPRYLVEDSSHNLVPSGTPYTEDHGRTLDYVDAFISCLESDREDGLFETIGVNIAFSACNQLLTHIF
jgi:hypothetical protein